jgi:hypothetical protein
MKRTNMHPYSTTTFGKTAKLSWYLPCQDIGVQELLPSQICHQQQPGSLQGKIRMKMEDDREVLTVFHVPPQHFDQVDFAMKFGVKHTYMASCLQIVLDLRLFVGKIIL